MAPIPEKKLKRWQLIVAIVIPVLLFLGAVRVPMMHMVGIQPRATAIKEYEELSGRIDHLGRLELGTRQMVACLYWEVPPHRCNEFVIPGDDISVNNIDPR